MRALSPADCLTLWESGRSLHPLDQGLLAVHTAFPDARREPLADWPLGRRNRALAELRCACFGRWLRGWTACEQCHENLEFEVDGNALSETGATHPDPFVHVDGRSFRLPTSRDLSRLVGERDPSSAARKLLELCLAADSQDHSDTEETATDPVWTEAQIEAVGERMAQADPLAEILLDFECPMCGSSFQQSLDLATFLWSELEGRAKRLLLDVHTLASAYGWSETEILALSTARREFYLEMVRA